MSDRSAKRRLELAGAAIAPGLVLGTAYMLRQISLDALETKPFPVGDTAWEIERLGRAFDQTLAQLRQLRAKVDKSDRQDVADIFATQLSLLEDVGFLERIREAVRTHAVNTEHLIAVEVRRLETTFHGMKDDVLRSRFLDIQDVYHRLLRNLLEIECAHQSVPEADVADRVGGGPHVAFGCRATGIGQGAGDCDRGRQPDFPRGDHRQVARHPGAH